jgi:hypothetical protein
LNPRLPYATLKKYFLKKSKARDRLNVPVGVAVAAVLTGTVKPFGATLKKASKKFVEANFLYFAGIARGC